MEVSKDFKDFKQAEKDYQTLQEFENIMKDDMRLLRMLSYRSAKAKAKDIEESISKDSYDKYVKSKINKNYFTSPEPEAEAKKEEVEEAAKRVVDKLSKILESSILPEDLDGIDLEIYFR